MQSQSFSRHDLPQPVYEVFKKWWYAISGEAAAGPARADRAVLRRAHDLTAVACTPAFQRLYRALAEAKDGPAWGPVQQEHIAAFVGLSVHVERSNELSVPKAMSRRQVPTDANPVSPLRFRRLLDSPDVESLFVGLRRTLPLVDHSVNIRRLVLDVFDWGDAVKRKWAYDYEWRTTP